MPLTPWMEGLTKEGNSRFNLLSTTEARRGHDQEVGIIEGAEAGAEEGIEGVAAEAGIEGRGVGVEVEAGEGDILDQEVGVNNQNRVKILEADPEAEIKVCCEGVNLLKSKLNFFEIYLTS